MFLSATTKTSRQQDPISKGSFYGDELTGSYTQEDVTDEIIAILVTANECSRTVTAARTCIVQ